MGIQNKINKRNVDALKPGAREAFLWDTKLAGFGVRCYPTGQKIYFIKMRAGKRQRWITIGKHGSPWTPDTARSEALRLLGKRESGTDPATERDNIKENPTIEELGKQFLEEHAEAKRKESTAKEYRRLFDTIIEPKLGKSQACDIARADVARLHHSLRTTPYQANRVLAMLSKMFNWADKNGVRLKDGGNPARGVERYKEERRKLFLRADELTKIGAAMRDMVKEGTLEAQEAAAIRLLLFTGCRLSEVLTLKWDYVDMHKGEFRLPDSKTGAKIVPLGAPALAVLREIPRIKGNEYVIFSPRLKKRHLINLEKPWCNVREKAGLPDVRLHDLRHAYGSVGAGVGFGLPIILRRSAGPIKKASITF